MEEEAKTNCWSQFIEFEGSSRYTHALFLFKELKLNKYWFPLAKNPLFRTLNSFSCSPTLSHETTTTWMLAGCCFLRKRERTSCHLFVFMIIFHCFLCGVPWWCFKMENLNCDFFLLTLNSCHSLSNFALKQV